MSYTVLCQDKYETEQAVTLDVSPYLRQICRRVCSYAYAALAVGLS